MANDVNNGKAHTPVNNINVVHVTATETYRTDNSPVMIVNPAQTQMSSVASKKASSFQITSVTENKNPRLNSEPGDESEDNDLEESRTEDTTDTSDTKYISEKAGESSDLGTPNHETIKFTCNINAIPSPIIPSASGKYGVTIVTTDMCDPSASVLTNTTVNVPAELTDLASEIPRKPGSMDDMSEWKSKFKIVKIERTEPYKRGRWECMDFLDQGPANQSSNTTTQKAETKTVDSTIPSTGTLSGIPQAKEMKTETHAENQQANPIYYAHQQPASTLVTNIPVAQQHNTIQINQQHSSIQHMQPQQHQPVSVPIQPHITSQQAQMPQIQVQQIQQNKPIQHSVQITQPSHTVPASSQINHSQSPELSNQSNVVVQPVHPTVHTPPAHPVPALRTVADYNPVSTMLNTGSQTTLTQTKPAIINIKTYPDVPANETNIITINADQNTTIDATSNNGQELKPPPLESLNSDVADNAVEGAER